MKARGIWRGVLAAVGGFVVLGALSPRLTLAQKLPDYPRVDLAPIYQVDPNWPQRPARIKWAAVSGIAVDASDRIWVFTRAKPPVQVYNPAGKYLAGWGSEQIHTAHHLKIDHAGQIWVADIGLHVVMQFAPDGTLLRTIGTRGQPGCDEQRLNMPTDMAITAAGEVFVADGYGNNRIVHFDAQNRFVKAWGTMGIKPGDFSLPHAIALDSKGLLYVADRNNVRVQIFDQTGKLRDVWANVLVPWGFWITAKDEIWVCGGSPSGWAQAMPGEPLGVPPKDQLFIRFTPTGRPTQMWTIPKGQDGQEKPGELNWVHALAVDSKGNIYAGDIKGQRAQKFVPRTSPDR